MGIVHCVMECGPVMLVGAVSILRPLQQVLCTLVADNKLYELAAKYAVRAAADNI